MIEKCIKYLKLSFCMMIIMFVSSYFIEDPFGIILRIGSLIPAFFTGFGFGAWIDTK